MGDGRSSDFRVREERDETREDKDWEGKKNIWVRVIYYDGVNLFIIKVYFGDVFL